MKKKEKYDYFEEFIKVTEYIEESSNKLKELMNNFNVEQLDKSIEEIHKLEHSSDRVVHKMREYLIKDFLPPIEREDIAVIINKLDDIEDGIDEIAIDFKILNVKKVKGDILEFVDILVQAAKAVKGVFEKLSDLKHPELIKEKVIVVNKLEEQGDRVYERIVSNLYKEEKDPIELIKWVNIYKCFEETIDSCEEISDCIQDVIMKNS
ncbi:MAG: DUF47 family protein [Bacilli bacterium]|nr:DUF47 family protein [Bacilli bacterium]